MQVLALDFDGVICDSARECLVTACFARAAASGEPFEPRLDAVSEDLRVAFSQMRPFVRVGMDYLVALHLIEREIPIAHQADFDRELAARLSDICRIYGVRDADALETNFHDARRSVREQDLDAWLALNPLYSKMADALRAFSGHLDAVYVVTNKPTSSVLAILEHHDVSLPEPQVLGSDKFESAFAKNDHLHRVKGTTNISFEDIYFLDDQVTHLVAALPLGVRCFLAEWGYTSGEQIEAAKRAGITMCKKAELPQWIGSVVRGSDNK